MIYLQLFLSFFHIGLFSIGGGYAAMPLIEEQTVILNNWITAEMFGDVVTIAEMTPGPISLNAATFVGTYIAGFPGALAATIGCVFPSTIIVFALSYIYFKYKSLGAVNAVLTGVRPAVIALILSAGFNLFCMSVYGVKFIPKEWFSIDYIALPVIIIAFIVVRKLKVKPIGIMVVSGAIYTILKLIIN